MHGHAVQIVEEVAGHPRRLIKFGSKNLPPSWLRGLFLWEVDRSGFR